MGTDKNANLAFPTFIGAKRRDLYEKRRKSIFGYGLCDEKIQELEYGNLVPP
jgi:hypothetical protein